MSTDEVPIWEVIDEFKERVKGQEAEIKKRRDRIEASETELEGMRLALEER
ncbi:MAG: hypothetical protein GX307_05585, partial [Euryarchaeota archaeon]|nr:hypothetical protein [Euryarchaeota archaeon]